MTLDSFGFGLVPVAASLHSCLGRFRQRTAQDNELHKNCVDRIVHALIPRQCAHVFLSQITQISAFATLEGTTLILFLSRGSIHQSNCWSNGSAAGRIMSYILVPFAALESQQAQAGDVTNGEDDVADIGPSFFYEGNFHGS
jgi:hypothetical protein